MSAGAVQTRNGSMVSWYPTRPLGAWVLSQLVRHIIVHGSMQHSVLHTECCPRKEGPTGPPVAGAMKWGRWGATSFRVAPKGGNTHGSSFHSEPAVLTELSWPVVPGSTERSLSPRTAITRACGGTHKDGLGWRHVGTCGRRAVRLVPANRSKAPELPSWRCVKELAAHCDAAAATGPASSPVGRRCAPLAVRTVGLGAGLEPLVEARAVEALAARTAPVSAHDREGRVSKGASRRQGSRHQRGPWHPASVTPAAQAAGLEGSGRGQAGGNAGRQRCVHAAAAPTPGAAAGRLWAG